MQPGYSQQMRQPGGRKILPHSTRDGGPLTRQHRRGHGARSARQNLPDPRIYPLTQRLQPYGKPSRKPGTDCRTILPLSFLPRMTFIGRLHRAGCPALLRQTAIHPTSIKRCAM